MLDRTVVVAALAVALAPTPARADTGDSESSYEPGRAVRRSDFAAGLLVGAAAGNAAGYPNDLSKIDVARYEASTGFGAGPATGLWLGGALRDWFVFGVGFATATVSGQGYQSKGTSFVLHVEGYPLIGLGGVFRDLGLLGEFGAGGRSIAKDGQAAAEGGAMSVASLGLVYEPLQLGAHFSAGPVLAITHQFSQSLSATLGVVGIRVAYYGGPG
jgi:hypothetical protein